VADLPPGKQIHQKDSNKMTFKKQKRFKNRKMLVFGFLSLILLIIWLISRQQKNSNVTQNQSANSVQDQQTANKIKQAAKRLSLGEKILISADNNPDKQAAVKKFAAHNFIEAQTKFTDSLEHYPNDPEALIYYNNSLLVGESETITIGVSIPVGGNLDVAKEILRGVAQAQNEINQQGGIERDGIKTLLRVQIANDDNQPEIAQQVAANFVANPQIMGVVGHNSSDASIAAAPIYQKGGLVMISPTSTAREISQAGSYIFRTTPSTRVLADALAEYTVDKLHQQKIAVCADSTSPASQSFKDEFSLSLSESGGEVTPTSCNFAGANFNPDEIPAKAIADASEALLLIPSVDKINQALDVARANQNRLTILGNDVMYTYETLKVGQSDIKGIVIPTAWHPNATADPTYNQNAVKLWGMPGNWRTATAYDATKALIAGLSTAKTRQELQQALSNPGFAEQGALGTINFKLSGDRQSNVTLIKVQPGKSSGTGYDFVSVNSP
jgi:branched-chain amino acid transport system substrate-binding protein